MEWNVTDEILESPSGEDLASGEGKSSGILTKGQWTPAEDAILRDYVEKHGEGNWNAVQKFSGLTRCGKSCRLRWANHLKPNLKRGAFTPEEVELVIKLHAKLGNKWAKMAAELPGRTDNEIKNFWNTRIKRHQRSGLPIYPPEVCLKLAEESQQSPHSATFSIDLPSSHHFMEPSDFMIPEFKIERPLNPSLFLDIPTSKEPPLGLGLVNTPNGLCDTASRSLFENQIIHAHHLPELYSSNSPLLCIPLGSHALTNGNLPTSAPGFGSVKLELPSLQSSESDFIFWGAPASPRPSFASKDSVAPSPQVGPDLLQPAPDTDGLLESVVCPPNRLKTSNLDDLSLDPEWWEVLCDQPVTPMGPSANGNSTDELLSADVILGKLTHENHLHEVVSNIFFLVNQVSLCLCDFHAGNEGKISDADPKQHLTSSNLNEIRDSCEWDPWRPDTWFNAALLSPETEHAREYQRLQETISAICGDDA
uniref:Uncharacterized protein n=1 Tax=Kalanchoe fedtschenkoi TaxID=63787 RepID=A0A7N0VJY8_KALFE